MQVTVLGAGNRYSVDLLPASLLVESGGVTLLVNCGPGIPQALHYENLIPRLTHVFVQDGSFSTIGGLELLGLRAHALYNHSPLLLYYKLFSQFFLARLGSEFFKATECFKVHDIFKPVFLSPELKLIPFPGDNGGCGLGLETSSARILISGNQKAPSSQALRMPYEEKWDAVFHHVAFDGERSDVASFTQLRAELKHLDHVYMLGYRDRDLITTADMPLVLKQGQTIKI